MHCRTGRWTPFSILRAARSQSTAANGRSASLLGADGSPLGADGSPKHPPVLKHSSGKTHGRHHSRRSLLTTGLAFAAGITLPLPAFAALPRREERALNLHLAHTGESFRGTYWAQGRYIPQALTEINYLLRDQHNGEVIGIDPRLLDLVSVLRVKLDAHHPVDILCGYRSPQTNETLYDEGENVAKHSYHIKGMAVDVRLPGQSLKHLYRAARSLKAGGVGYYPRAHFIHLDLGAVRTW